MLLSSVACSTNDGSLQIYSAIAIDKTPCALSPDSETYLDVGMYDPKGFFGAPKTYSLNLIAKNTMSTPAEGSSTSGSENANDAEIVAMDVCWFPAHPGSAGAPEYADYADGVPESLTCDRLPDAQKTTKVLSAPVSAGGRSALGLEILDTAALQTMYGTDFQPWALPLQGPFAIDLGIANWYYSLGASDPTDLEARHSAWGNFPASRSARVIVQVRANAVLLSGGTVQSNWFIFPVDVCVGCAALGCGYQRLVECTDGDRCPDGQPCPPGGKCEDGSFCTGATCPDGSECPKPRCSDGSACTTGAWYLLGDVPDSEDTCQPHQDGGPNCIELEGCPGTDA
jgi:hypothetical protein